MARDGVERRRQPKHEHECDTPRGFQQIAPPGKLDRGRMRQPYVYRHAIKPRRTDAPAPQPFVGRVPDLEEIKRVIAHTRLERVAETGYIL